jgi:hypothetical protein
VPRQALLRTIKRWLRYQPRGQWTHVPKSVRGLYVLYKKGRAERYEVTYIGVAGLGPTGGGGIRSRLKSHAQKKPEWTHFSLFEVHDNIDKHEILELEALLLSIFRHDSRIQLSNKQTSSRKFYELRKTKHWKTA